MNSGTRPSTYSVSGDFFDRGVEAFSAALGALITKSALNLENFPIDHVAMRPTTTEAFRAMQRVLTQRSSAVSSREVNGRDILVFRLTHPVEVLGRRVDFVELPFPKTQSGPSACPWDHVEFVVPVQARTLDELAAWMSGSVPDWQAKVSESVICSREQPTVAGSEPPNPSLTFKDRDTGILFRLHPVSLETLRVGSWSNI